MPPPAKHSTVLGYCPGNFREEMTFVFVHAAAELLNGRWLRVGSPSTSFAPHGDFFVPREAFPGAFRHRDVAAWEAEDQPNYALQGHSCRFRAVRVADAPLEVVRAECASSDPAACRRFLLEEGLEVVPRRQDGQALVEFQDGLIARVRLHAHPDRPRQSVAAAGDLAQPLGAWPLGQAPELFTVSCDGLVRRFAIAAELHDAPARLDLATLEEAVTSATRAGGLGAPVSAPPGELRRALERLEEVVRHFGGAAWAARRARLADFLERARQAAEERARWEDYLAGHPVFREALEAAVSERLGGLREEARQSILKDEASLRETVSGLATECEEWEGLARTAREEAERIQGQVHGLAGERTAAEAELERLRAEQRSVTAPGAARGAENGTAGHDGAVLVASRFPALAGAPVPRSGDSAPEPGDPFATAAEAIKRLEQNFHALGVLKGSARLLAREVFVALSLGQAAFFRGSLAEPVAEAAALSLAGSRVQNVTVPLGAAEPFEVPPVAGEETSVVVFQGVNRACFGTYGERVARLVRDRALGRAACQAPLFLGALGDGPSFLPPGPEFLTFGPVFDTDCLSWDLRKAAGELKRGCCAAPAWVFEEGDEPEEWAELIDGLFAAENILWERQARAALRRLQSLADPERSAQPGASFLFGWVLPRLLGPGGEFASLADRFHDGVLHEAAAADQRVQRLLSAHGAWEGGR
jgi:hypothetical protein